MALMADKAALFLFLFSASFYLISGARVRDQAPLAHQSDYDEFTKDRTVQPDVSIQQKELEAPLGSFAPYPAHRDSEEVMSSILRDLQPLKAMALPHLALKKTKRWSLYDPREGDPFQRRRAKFLQDMSNRSKSHLAGKWGLTIRRLHKRHLCMTKSLLQNGGGNVQRPLTPGKERRCERSPSVAEKGSKNGAILMFSKGSKSRTDAWQRSDLRSLVARKKKQVLKERRKRLAYAKGPRFLPPKPSPVSPDDLLSALRASLERLRRSPSHPVKGMQNENWEETILNHLLKTMEEGGGKSAKKEQHLEKRDANGTLSVKTVHLTLSALKTQEKLSEMVAHITDPSNNMTKEEKLSYMHELLNELTTFIQLLQQQVVRHAQKAAAAASAAPPQT